MAKEKEMKVVSAIDLPENEKEKKRRADAAKKAKK